MLKKAVALCLTAVCLFLWGCTLQKEEETALTVSGAPVSSALFAYYFDKVAGAPENYGLTQKDNPDVFADKAVKLCTRHVAINTLFAHYGLTLNNNSKITVAEDVNALWIAFGNHYRKVGVSRSVLSEVRTNAAYEDAIFTALYDSEDRQGSAEQKIKGYFAQNYIIFRTVSAYFITSDAAGSEIVMTDAQQADLVKTFEGFVSEITDLGSFEKIPAQQGYTAASTVLLKKGQEGYPEGFFDAVQGMESNRASAVRFGDSVFLIWKFNPDDREAEYGECRTQCVKDLYSEDAEALFADVEKELTVERNETVIREFVNNMAQFG